MSVNVRARLRRKRKRMNDIDSRAVRGRIALFVRKVYGSWPTFEAATGIKRSTWKGWSRGRGSLPNLEKLQVLARKTSLDFHWLLTGEGAMLRANVVSTPEGELVALLEGYLRSQEGAGPDEALQVWTRIASLVDAETGEPAAFQAALEGLRPLYRRLLEDCRDFEVARRVVAEWSRDTMGITPGVEGLDWQVHVTELSEALLAQLRRRDEDITLSAPTPRRARLR